MPRLKFVLAGVPVLINALDDLTPELVNEVERMQAAKATVAAERIRALYPRRDGNLAAGVRTRRLLKGRVVAATVIENTWWLSSIYEHGTRTIRYTKKGESRGQMPAKPTFWPVVNQTQREVHNLTIAILKRHGLTVLSAVA